MASVIQMPNGKWRTLVRKKGHKFRCKTFETYKEANAWGRMIEAGIDKLDKETRVAGDDMTVRAMLTQYRTMREELGRPIEPVTNTHYMLQHLSEDIGDERICDLTPKRLAQWAKMRQEQGAGGYTVNMELSALGTAIRHTGSFLNIVLPDVVGAARPLLHYSQLIGGGTKRTRRPTEDELCRLLDYLGKRNPVVRDAVEVGAITGMRRGELTRIRWDGIDEDRRAVLVTKRKHPRAVLAKDEWVPLLGDSWDIVQRQPRTSDRIFPVSPETLTDSVTDGTRLLGIPNLHLHDMRRHANSALREMGFDSDARQAILGHSSREMNSRYVAVDIDELHDRFNAAQGTRQRPKRQRTDSGHPSEATETPRPADDS